MKKHTIRILLMAFALIGTAALFSCDDDDSNDTAPVPKELTLLGIYEGKLIGTSKHFEGMVSTTVDTIIVSVSEKNSTLFDVEVRSGYWGYGTFEAVNIIENNDTFRLDNAEGTFRMPKRTPGETEVTYNDYPATIGENFVLVNGNKVGNYLYTIDVNLGERAGIYSLVMTNVAGN